MVGVLSIFVVALLIVAIVASSKIIKLEEDVNFWRQEAMKKEKED